MDKDERKIALTKEVLPHVDGALHEVIALNDGISKGDLNMTSGIHVAFEHLDKLFEHADAIAEALLNVDPEFKARHEATARALGRRKPAEGDDGDD